jgi:hypothetical protein
MSKPASETMFENLVNNAIDFLEHSIKELGTEPKYSVIHFQAAIELILKARLMKEHWSLVVSAKREPDWNEFVSGNFVSVTMDEAITKLHKVAQSGLSSAQQDAFKTITKHRNRIVHFFHKAESDRAEQGRIRKIIKEQLTAWYYLHDLMLKQWIRTFAPWRDVISRIDRELRKNHVFLQAVFNDRKAGIESERSGGTLFIDCPACGFASERHDSEIKEAYNSDCVVCGFSETCVRIDCDACSAAGTVIFHGSSDTACSQCDVTYGSKTLLATFVDEGEAYLAVVDGGNYPFPVNCGACSGYETVVDVGGNQYLCAECFALTDEYGVCESCHDESTELGDDTMWAGCEFCEGMAARYRDD